MKYLTLIIAFVFLGVTTFAQDLTSKKGETMLPEEGDYSIGFDAAPFLNYVGNFLNGNGTNSAPTLDSHTEFASGSGLSITGKMFADAQTAYRGRVRIGFGSDKATTMVPDLSPGANAKDMVEDESKFNYTSILLGGGIEKRLGSTRLQGLYGGEALVTLGSSKSAFEYGNDAEDVLAIGSSRTLETKSGGRTGFGVGAFVGVEYFIAPKVSIGGEYNWGLRITSTGAGEVETEMAVDDGAGGVDIDTETVEGSISSNSFGFDTGIIGAFSLMLLVHF